MARCHISLSAVLRASYFVSFIEDSTRKVWAYPIRTKDRVFSIFSDWLAMVENQTGQKLKCLRTNNGGEFKSEEFVKFCRERGIRREYTTPYSPEQNGIGERMNQTIQECIVSMSNTPDFRMASGRRLYLRQYT